MTAERAALAFPRLGAGFEVTGFLGVGATCEVFTGRHLSLDVPIAIKVLRPELTDEADLVERMRVEAHLLPRLRSRHIVRCYDRGATEDGRPYTVLELLRGETLERLLERLRVFDELTAIHFGGELCEALSVVHALGAVHRDISLRNLIAHQPQHEPCVLKLIDFGFARILPDAPESAPVPCAVRTDPDTTVGTPRYISPEAALGNEIDGRADVYSTGVVLYSLLAGRDPYAELRSTAEVLEAHAYLPAPRLSRFTAAVPKELERVVMRMLEKDPSDRFQSAREAGEALFGCGETIRERMKRMLVQVPDSTQSEPGKARVIQLDHARSPAPRVVFRPGERCGPYVIDGLIDGGGFSEVYEAHPVEGTLTRPVAIKVLKKVFATDRRMRERFQKEIQLLATIRHPNVVTLYQAGEHEGMCWMAMELIPGASVRVHVRRRGRIGIGQSVLWAHSIASALNELHRLGILHRDLKPDNVIVNHLGEICVVDAGLAKLVSDAQKRTSRHILGTVAYMPPEALMGLPLDARSDMYALGLMLFEMLVGRHPYADPAPPHRLPPTWQMTLHHLNDPIPRQKDVARDVPESLWALVRRMTEKRPELRPSNMVEVCEALEAIAEELAGLPERVPSARSRLEGATPRARRRRVGAETPAKEGTPQYTREKALRLFSFGIALGALLTAITWYLFVTLH